MSTPPVAPEVETRVREAFAGQQFMTTLGARLTTVASGAVTITCDVGAHLTQQRGFVHAGVVATLADTAGGFAALTLVGHDQDILTADFSINLLRPATGHVVVASAHVVKHGRKLTICRADVHGDVLCAIATITLATV